MWWRSGTSGRWPREVRGAAGDGRRGGRQLLLPGHTVRAEASFRPAVALVHTLSPGQPGGDRGLAPDADGRHRRRRRPRSAPRLGLSPVDGFGALLDRQTSLLVTCPEGSTTPRPRGANVRYVGPVLKDAGSGRRARRRPPGVDDGRPLVVVGLGTTRMDEGPVLQRLLAALGVRPGRVLATLGAHLRPRRPPVPGNVRLSGLRASHAAMLPWASAVVSHGGLGHGARGACPRAAPGLRAPRP